MGQSLCCTQVDQSTVAVTEQFGKFSSVLEPGCHCLPSCFGYKLVGLLSLRVQQLDVRCETKTKDNVFVTVVASIQYRAMANKAAEAFYKLTNPREQIQAYVFDVIRASVPKQELDMVFEQKNEIAKAVEEELEKAMSTYGFEIVQTLIVDIEPDVHVKRAMNEINAGKFSKWILNSRSSFVQYITFPDKCLVKQTAARLRVAANEKAEGEKILQIKKAEGEAESKYLSGLGIARQRQAIYFDTMKEIGASSKSSAVFIPHGPGAVKDVASQIRDGLLQAESVEK
ncbi:hypothetical protein RD792_001734 [Penstemon davidsonii]|uniref:Band 7 domain-containing protein n=1 Tax=Penstemon davidsonii TaxID=160366 RepID=A0ABR0DP56_9LAMI|nr:hypothetical protein RD792_001734 [Penstemon davidsonii]